MALVTYFPCNEGTGTVLYDNYGTNNLTRLAGDIGWHSPGHGSNASSYDPLSGALENQAFAWGTVAGGPFSYAHWCYLISTATGAMLVGNGNAGGTNHWLRRNSTNIDLPGTQPIAMNEWVHLALVIQNYTYQYYINGSPATSGNFSTQGWASMSNIIFGSYAVTSFIHPAYINDAYFFNHALTQDEVVQCMNNTYISTPSSGVRTRFSKLRASKYLAILK